MERCRIVFSGSGGQGLISAAVILAEAAVIHENLQAIQSQSYGAAARGGAVRSDVVLSDDTIYMPKVFQPNILLCMTQQAYEKFRPIIRPGGLLITDTKFVEVSKRVDACQVELPLYQTMMDKIAQPMAFNITVLGALLGLSPLISLGSVVKILDEKFPKNFLDLNRQALEIGHELGEDARRRLNL